MTPNDASARAEAYFTRLRDANVAALWTIPGTLATEPTLDEVPHVWRSEEIFPLLHEAVAIADLGEETDRRALNAFNPTRKFGTSHNLVAGYQLVLPGETAPAHRHTPSAIRLLLQGSGHTVVDGEPVFMERGDLVLTPPNTWHDHRHNGTEAMIWLDGLDVPFVRGQHAQFAEEYPGGELQKLTQDEDASVHRYFAGLNPVDEGWAKRHSPLNKYPYASSRRALLDYHRAQGEPLSGSRLEYVNPLTGGHVIPTLACYLSWLPEAGRTTIQRQTASSVFCVLEGRGYSIIEGERYDWAENDFFVVPSWHRYEHVAESDHVVLFELSDLPIYEPFGLLRTEVGEEGGLS